MAKAARTHSPTSDLLSDLRLAVDVGNTQTVLGLFNGARILKHWRLATRRDLTVDEITLSLQGLVLSALPVVQNAAATASLLHPFVRCALASVVPAQDAPWRAALAAVFGGPNRLPPRVLNHRDCGGLRLDYELPSQIGADRLANVLGAQALGVREGVVVDFGTATTFDVFSGGAYHGGIICPGLQTGMRALAQNAARLHEAELSWPAASVGRTTDEALRIGILRGAVGMVEHLLRDILTERKMRKPVVIATGGLAPWLKTRTAQIHRFEPDLTLMGINALFDTQAPAPPTLKSTPQPRTPLSKSSRNSPEKSRKKLS
jgi:type III pantothenate kinase